MRAARTMRIDRGDSRMTSKPEVIRGRLIGRQSPDSLPLTHVVQTLF